MVTRFSAIKKLVAGIDKKEVLLYQKHCPIENGLKEDPKGKRIEKRVNETQVIAEIEKVVVEDKCTLTSMKSDGQVGLYRPKDIMHIIAKDHALFHWDKVKNPQTTQLFKVLCMPFG